MASLGRNNWAIESRHIIIKEELLLLFFVAAKPLLCSLNEVAVKSRTICPPQNCEIAYTDYDCSNYKNISEPGCDCLPNYLRNGSGVCIPNDECPCEYIDCYITKFV